MARKPKVDQADRDQPIDRPEDIREALDRVTATIQATNDQLAQLMQILERRRSDGEAGPAGPPAEINTYEEDPFSEVTVTAVRRRRPPWPFGVPSAAIRGCGSLSARRGRKRHATTPERRSSATGWRRIPSPGRSTSGTSCFRRARPGRRPIRCPSRSWRRNLGSMRNTSGTAGFTSTATPSGTGDRSSPSKVPTWCAVRARSCGTRCPQAADLSCGEPRGVGLP